MKQYPIYNNSLNITSNNTVYNGKLDVLSGNTSTISDIKQFKMNLNASHFVGIITSSHKLNALYTTNTIV